MSLFAIGDLHLSGAVYKPMDIFGDNWTSHQEKIKGNWNLTVGNDDMVLIPGDISWAMNLQEAKCDLDFLAELPGKKVLLRGNHDYWWGSVSRLNSLYDNMVFLQNDFAEYEGIAVCGSRGWSLPNDINYSDSDLKTYIREQIRYKLSLDAAIKKGFNEIIFMTHFPPIIEGSEESGFVHILKEYNIKTVVYGHLHGEESFKSAFNGKKYKIDFKLVSADYLNFCPLKIID